MNSKKKKEFFLEIKIYIAKKWLNQVIQKDVFVDGHR